MAELGYTKVVSVKTTATTAYSSLPGSAASFDFGGEMLDDTDFTSTGWRSRVRGLKDYSISLTAFYGSTNAALEIVKDAVISGATLDFRYLPNGTNGFGGQVICETYNLSGDVGGLETVEISMPSFGTALSTL